MDARYDDPSGSIHYDEGWAYDSEPATLPQRKRTVKKPKLELKQKTASDLAVSAGIVQTQMTTNAALFPSSAADVTALGGELTGFEAAIAEAETARVIASEKIAARENERAKVEARMSKLAGQVHDVAQGNVETIHAAGMAATNDPSPVTMTQVLNLKLKASDQEGELLGSCDSVKGSKYLRIQISTEAAPGNWKDHLTTTKSRFALNHTLVSGQKVYVRICAGNANGEGPWSDIGWKTVP